MRGRDRVDATGGEGAVANRAARDTRPLPAIATSEAEFLPGKAAVGWTVMAVEIPFLLSINTSIRVNGTRLPTQGAGRHGSKI